MWKVGLVLLWVAEAWVPGRGLEKMWRVRLGGVVCKSHAERSEDWAMPHTRHSLNFETAECTASEAALFVGVELASESADATWMRATEVKEAPPRRQAVARLRRDTGTIDALRLNFPKEDWTRARGALGACVDALIEVWLEEASKGRHYERLRAATDAHTAPVFEARGFQELDHPDLTALGRGEAIATHRARLPQALFAYENKAVLSHKSDRICRFLRQQPVLPQPPDDDDTPQTKTDPWNGLGRTFF